MKKDLKTFYRWGAGAFACLALIVFFWARFSGDKAPAAASTPRQVKIMELQYSDQMNSRTFPGEVRPANQVDLAFRVPGTLSSLPVVRGQSVKMDDLIADLDKRDFQSGLERVQSQLQGENAALAAMKTGRSEDVTALSAQLKAANVKFEESRLSLNRYASLLDAGAVSKADYDRIKAAHDVAREEVRVAEQNLAKARAGSREEEIERQEAYIRSLETMLRDAEDALRDTELRAPFDGVIAELYVENFQAVQKDQRIAALQNIRALEVVVSLPGRMLLGLNPQTRKSISNNGDEAVIKARFPNFPDRLFDLQFKEAVTKGNVQTQTYDVSFFMERPADLTVLPGMGIDVLISIRESDVAQNAFPVPRNVLEGGEGKTQYVWKIERKNEKLEVRRAAVEVVGYLDDRPLISGDVKPGDRIVAAGLSYLQDGDEVALYASPENAGKDE